MSQSTQVLEAHLARVARVSDDIAATFGDGGVVLSESQALYFAGHSNEFGGHVFGKMVADGLLIQRGWGAGGHPRYSL